MADTFSWFPDAEQQVAVSPRVRTAVFGDGYEQRVADGINTSPEIWSLTFTRNRTEIAQIEAFLHAQGGVKYFLWTNPEEVSAKYICRKWSKSRQRRALSTLNCEFEQVFDL